MKWNPRAKRLAGAALTAAFFALVVWMLHGRLRELDPREIVAALRALSPARVAVALLLTAVAYVLVAAYDRLSAHHAGIRLPASRNFAIAFVSYAFNFNLGATVGALGFRYRLYSRVGVDHPRIAAIAAFSIVTNWCGCLSVFGAMLIADPSALRLGWELSPAIARLCGALALAPVAGYLAVTAFRRAPVRIRGTAYAVPSLRFALAQVGLASAYWLLVPVIIGLLGPPGAPIAYSRVVVAYGLAALGGIVVRVPAGLGVIEAVFLEIFRGTAGAGPVLAMLIAWRAIFLLAPLMVAAAVLAVLEYSGRGTARRATTQRQRARA